MITIDEKTAKVLRELMTECALALVDICADLGTDPSTVWGVIGDGTPQPGQHPARVGGEMKYDKGFL